MTTQYHALRLPQQVNDVVLEMARNNHVDLNSVYGVNVGGSDCITVGEPKTRKTIDVYITDDATRITCGDSVVLIGKGFKDHDYI